MKSKYKKALRGRGGGKNEVPFIATKAGGTITTYEKDKITIFAITVFLEPPLSEHMAFIDATYIF